MFNNLSDLEVDALTEIFNIGIGRAADSLNKMTSQTVDLNVPNVQVMSSRHAKEMLGFSDHCNISAVTQKFSGDFSGQAFLMFSQDSGLKLIRTLLSDDIPVEVLSDLEQDSLVEIGNIILNACFGTVINFLKSTIEIDMPEFVQGDINEIFTYASDNDWSLYIEVKFTLPSDNIEGYISFIMDIQSLERFQESVRLFVGGI